MFINSLPDLDGSRCTLTFEEPNQWLRATWRGFVEMEEAMRGATNYLAHASRFRSPYLLNDNYDLSGPWFDSLEWLEYVWLPHALDLGLRYVAHVVQADTHADFFTRTLPEHLTGALELQIFQEVAQAEAWLRSCQQRARADASLAQH